MKQVALYPFNKISQGLIRFHDLLDFQITSVIDFTFQVGEDVGTIINHQPLGIVVEDDLEKAFTQVDTLILNDGGAPIHHFAKLYETCNLREKWKDVLRAAKQRGIEIISTHEITDSHLSKWLQEEQIHIHTYTQTKDQLHQFMKDNQLLPSNYPSKKIGIYGTRSCIGKFTAQMYLMKAFQESGRKARALITEPTAELFHQYDVDPIRFLELLPDPIKYNQYMKAIVNQCQREHTEYIIMASQQGLAFNGKDNIYGNLIRLSNMVEFDPDHILLIVGYDDDEAINDCMELIRIYGEGKKPLAFLLPDKIEIGYGQYEEKTEEEQQQRKQTLIDKFHVAIVESIKDIKHILPFL
ncbi:DUF1611 domain-containing protein [Anaerosporobacter faecicola]|uniref:DUF1611 domain-containing protein n=1 Tax=Anaerosporobacter faecicola TaxID=2718714 RepID=UPI00143BD521|nr:DUF1611 domain-containing protein [Anaerosporobacter faecicola]